MTPLDWAVVASIVAALSLLVALTVSEARFERTVRLENERRQAEYEAAKAIAIRDGGPPPVPPFVVRRV